MTDKRATSSGQIQTVEVGSYEEVGEAWKCPHLSSSLSGPGEEIFHRGVIVRLNGKEHIQRRRVMGLLLKSRGHKAFRDNALFPTADAELARVLAEVDERGFSRMEVLSWAQRVNFKLASAIVGFDEGRSGPSADRLAELMETLIRNRPTTFEVSVGEADFADDRVRKAVAAKEEIIESYFDPALERRERLVAEFNAGLIEEDDLPQDLLTLIARGLDPAWEDRGLAEREALFLFNAGVHTTSVSVYWSLREWFLYLESHPEAAGRIEDDQFVMDIASEALRLHPITNGFARLATEDVALAGGTKIPEGSLALIRNGPAGLEPEVFGEDAAEFRPGRERPAGVKPYAYGFGAGSHMCYGVPLVLGSEGLDGSLVYLLKLILRAGAQPDPDSPAAPDLVDARGEYRSESDRFDVVFPTGR